ncbi:garvicin Q family class II bacteriocin [Streptococcus uberis]|nr:garvicin Q family class II bacteriocin [Streptococcus uberis]MCK1255765.1 garvicin Q family class II bacteriocin [Streptococcus uberis]
MKTKSSKQFTELTVKDLSAVIGGAKGVCKYVYPGSNGYACRYPNGEWGYIVTKSNFEAPKDVIVNGWVSSLGGGYFHGNRG